MPAELAKFDAGASRFWDPQGEFRPLHLLNPVRTRFISERATLAGRARAGCRLRRRPARGGLARDGARVTAIDLAPGMIEVARLHAADAGLTIDYRVAAAEELARASPAAFDVVTCMEMLEHVPEPAAMLGDARAAAHARRRAVRLDAQPQPAAPSSLAIVGAEYLLKLIPRGTHEYERLIRPAELARWARAAGLTLQGPGRHRAQPLHRARRP